MKPAPQANGRYAAIFRNAYARSLQEYRLYYDNLTELGSPVQPDHVFYFVPGINGTPGQMRFMLPSLLRVFGERIYIKALHRPEFSAGRPTWEKYSIANVDRKLAQLRADLEDLLERFERVTVLCSSNGFYDFAAAAHDLVAQHPGRLFLLWGACAPDAFHPTPWERVFYPLNGFVHDGARWFAFPNHNALQVFNPEASASHVWSAETRRRTFIKADLESRFRCWGLDWCYTSPTRIAEIVQYVVSSIRTPLRLPADTLIAERDGYWQGRSRTGIAQIIRRYLPDCVLDFRPTSHLWVVTPSHVTDLFIRHRRRLQQAARYEGSASIMSVEPMRHAIDALS